MSRAAEETSNDSSQLSDITPAGTAPRPAISSTISSSNERPGKGGNVNAVVEGGKDSLPEVLHSGEVMPEEGGGGGEELARSGNAISAGSGKKAFGVKLEEQPSWEAHSLGPVKALRRFRYNHGGDPTTTTLAQPEVWIQGWLGWVESEFS